MLRRRYGLLISLSSLSALLVLLSCFGGHADSTGQLPFTPDGETDLWILAGQSNMVGCAIRTRDFEPDPRIWLYNMDNTWIPAIPPLHRIFESVAPVHRRIFWETDAMSEADFLKRGSNSKRTPSGGAGPGFFFAKHLIENIDSKIGLIASAHGGTSMEQWDPSRRFEGDDSLYGATLNRIQRVGGKIKGVLWYQGESEAMEPSSVASYEEDLLHLIDSFRTDTGIPDLPFLFVQIGRWALGNDPRGDTWETIRDIQRRIPSQRENVFMTSAIDLPLDDQIHLSLAGQERLGRRLGEIALTQVYGIENHAGPIRLKSMKVEKPESNRPLIRIQFEGVTGRLRSEGRPTGFEIRSQQSENAVSQVYRVEFDDHESGSLILRFGRPLELPAEVVYGPRFDPYVNIVDEEDMPIPAFSYVINE